MGRLVKRLRRLAAALLVVALAVAVVEASFRFFDPVGLSYFTEVSRYMAAMQPNPDYAYIHPPGMRDRFQGVDVIVNSHGFRGPETPHANPLKRSRVLILGDSVVFGWGVEQSAIVPAALQRLLEHEVPGVEVIPAGVGSWNTRTEYEYLRSEGVRFAPNVIVLMVTSNDLEPKRAGPATQPWLRTLWQGAVQRSYVAAYVQYLRRSHQVRRDESQASADSPQWEDARLALDGIIETARVSGAVLAVVLCDTADRVNLSPLRLYRDHLAAAGIIPWTLPDALFSDARLRNSNVDAHPNAAGHAMIAAALHEQLLLVLKRLGLS